MCAAACANERLFLVVVKKNDTSTCNGCECQYQFSSGVWPAEKSIGTRNFRIEDHLRTNLIQLSTLLHRCSEGLILGGTRGGHGCLRENSQLHHVMFGNRRSSLLLGIFFCTRVSGGLFRLHSVSSGTFVRQFGFCFAPTLQRFIFNEKK